MLMNDSANGWVYLNYNWMKLKGQVVKAGGREYTLRDQLGEGGFSMIYLTNHPDIVCKAQVLANPQIARAYAKEKEMLTTLKHPNLVAVHDAVETTIKDTKYGLLFMQKCGEGTALDILERSEGTNLSQEVVVDILLAVSGVLEYLHGRGIAFRDVKMENVLAKGEGEYKMCDLGSCEKGVVSVTPERRVEIEEHIEKTTTPLYRAPEQLDLYSNKPIGPKVDVFALGVMAFMLCFQKPPFEARLSAINKQYFLPEEHSYSPELVAFIERCFETDPLVRMSAVEAGRELRAIKRTKRLQVKLAHESEFALTLRQMRLVTEGSLGGSGAVAEAGLLDKIRRIYNQMTTETEGWIAGFVEDSEEAPMLQYTRSIIAKCYEKRYKVEKVYELIHKYAQEYGHKCLVVLKLLILLHNFLRKGPREAVAQPTAPLDLCLALYSDWKGSRKPTDEEDPKRNSFLCLLIRLYALALVLKIKLGYEHSELLEGNFSIAPYLASPKDKTLLKLPLLAAMIDYLGRLADFHEQLMRFDYVHEIQDSVGLSIVDEEYCLVSTLTFLLVAFKRAACHAPEDIDLGKLRERVGQVEGDYGRVYLRVGKLIERTLGRNTLISANAQMSLSEQVVGYIKGIQIERKGGEFVIGDHLNYSTSIFGLKLPLAYEEVVKNPNFLSQQAQGLTQQEMVELHEFRKSSQSSPQPPGKGSPSAVEAKQGQAQEAGEKKKESDMNGSKGVAETKSSFAKPKEAKDKIFDNFDFKKEKEKQLGSPGELRKESSVMEFTHQNLNKDFMSTSPAANGNQNDQFRDFFSIVEEKIEKKKEKKEPEVVAPVSNNSKASKEVFASENKPEIAKIELMNFFFDEEEQGSSSPPAKTEAKKTEAKPSKADLIDLGEEESHHGQEGAVAVTNVSKEEMGSSAKPDLISLEEQPQEKADNLAASKVSGRSEGRSEWREREPSGQSSVIDLRDFVVEEVRRNADQYVIDFGALVFREKIGYGNSSEVFRGEWRGQEVAIKKIKESLGSQRSAKEFRREIMTSVRIRHHPQLVTLIGVSEHQQHFYIINEFCDGSTLFDLLHQSSRPLPWPARISLARQIARGMVFLHSNDPPIIHRDLKSLNVLLVREYEPSTPEATQVKIADFGLSRDYASTYMTGTLGTYHWMAPEIFNNEPYTLKADVYSYGVVLWEIASRVPPYTNMKNPQSLMKFVTLENGRPDLGFLDRDCPLELRMLMVRCWDKFPSNRPSFPEILACLHHL